MDLKNYYNKAHVLDENDALAVYKSKFVIPENTIYLDGNSLGMLPRKTVETQEDLIRIQWGKRLIRGWNERWISLADKTASRIAALLGARPDEIFVGDTTSLNLFKLAYAVLKYKSDRAEILTDELNFPTDKYILQGLVENNFPTHNLKVVPSDDGITISTEQIKRQVSNNTALLSLSAVSYKSAFRYDMKAINELAKEKGALVLWDLSHAAGAVPVNLATSNTDLAVGCTYKYLNGGPGAPAFLYVNKKLQDKLNNPIWSWFGHKAPFEFDPVYKPHSSIQKFAVSTPHILSLDPVINGVALLLDAGMEKLWSKSKAQTAFLCEMIRNELNKYGFIIGSPERDSERGSHIALQHKEAYRISAALINPRSSITVILPDFRPDNTIRLGICPLYTSFRELVITVERIIQVMETSEYEHFSNDKPEVV